jgi:peroxiredoxin
MRRITLRVLTIFSIILLSSCQNLIKDDHAVISGKYHAFEEYVFLNMVTSNNVDILDSADLSEGAPFHFDVIAPEPSVYRLAHKELYPIMIIAENGDSIMIEQIDDEAWPFRVKGGGEECELLLDYLKRLNIDSYKVDSLSAIFQSSQNHPEFVNIRESLNRQFTGIYESHKEFARQFITRHPGSIAAIIVINSFFKEFALFDQHEDFKFYEIVHTALNEKRPESRYTKDFNAQFENIKAAREYELEAKMRLSRGRLVPEFNLPTTDGSTVGPQDFRGDNLMIYFWASTDAESRQMNKMVKKAYVAIKDYGFKVLAISFDKDPNYWEAAIELDSLPGIHATDLKGAGSPVQKLFNLKMRLPYYYLIDSKGRIFYHSNNFDLLGQKIIELYRQKQDY